MLYLYKQVSGILKIFLNQVLLSEVNLLKNLFFVQIRRNVYLLIKAMKTMIITRANNVSRIKRKFPFN